MQYQARDWKQVVQLAHSEQNAQQQNALCELARRLIHDRSLELAEEKIQHQIDSHAENDALNRALRDLWALQNQRSQPFDANQRLRLVS